MYYSTETVLVPDLSLMSQEFKVVEKMEWYSRLLIQHTKKTGQVDGIPIPLFVLKGIYEKQNKIRSAGFTGVMDIAYCLGNVACALHMETNKDIGNLTRSRITQIKMFEGDFLLSQRRKRACLLEVIREHKELLAKLRNKQMVYGKIYTKLDSCKNTLKEMERKPSRVKTSTKNTIQKYLLSKRVEKLTKTCEKERKILTKLIEKASDYNDSIQRTTIQLESEILGNIRSRVNTLTKNLQTVLSTCQKTERTIPIEKSLESLCRLSSTRTFYDNFSNYYYYPNIKDILPRIRYPKELPGAFIKELEGCRGCSDPDISTNLYVLECNSTAIVKPNKMLKNEKDVEMKCGLRLMGKTVRFGWYRKHGFSRKAWGIINVA